MFGYEAEELGTINPRSVYVDSKIGDEVFDNIMNGISWRGEIEMRSRDGCQFPVQLLADSRGG